MLIETVVVKPKRLIRKGAGGNWKKGGSGYLMTVVVRIVMTVMTKLVLV